MAQFAWFPGHMYKALKELKSLIKHSDLVLEIRDARVPFTSANPQLQAAVGNKRRIVVLNKADLADPNAAEAALASMRRSRLRAMLTNTSRSTSMHQLLQEAVGWLQAERPHAPLSVMLVVGLPNCGKSSVINGLKLAAQQQGVLSGAQAYQKRTVTGPTPGLTRQASGFVVCQSPHITMLDTPGVMMPKITSVEAGLNLALIGVIKDSIVGEEAMVKHFMQLLRLPTHQRVLQQATTRWQASIEACTSPGAAPGPSDPAKHQTRALLAMCHALLEASAADIGSRRWHPGLEDPQFGEAEQRLELLLELLGVAGQRDPSQQHGALVRIIKAFRTGQLGRYFLDES